MRISRSISPSSSAIFRSRWANGNGVFAQYDRSRPDHRQVTLKGIVAGLSKSTSRSGHKQMTFLLRSPVGCGGVIVYAQEPATLSNGDHLQVEGIFEMESRRDGSTFHNEMQAMKITTLPR